MMKKIIYEILFLGCLLFVGCEAATMEEKTSLVKVDGVSDIVFYENFGLTLNLKAVDSIEGNRKVYATEVTNSTEKEYVVLLSEIVFNDMYVIGEDEMFFADPLKTSKNLLEEMAKVAYSENVPYVTSWQCHLIIKDETYTVVEDCILNLDFDKPLVHAVDYDAYKEAKADGQILEENEWVKLTLIEWGKNPENSYLTAIVCIENQSDQIIPATISGMMINGAYFRTTDAVNYLEPGQRCYAKSSVLESEIENAGITSINEVQVLILTDETQNTGTLSYAGGSWYPIVLEEKGVADETMMTGEVLDLIDGIEISYSGMAGRDWSQDGNDGGCYEWKLAVKNDTDEHIRIGMKDLLVDGVPYDTWKESHPETDIYIRDSDVGANASRNMSICLSYETKIPRPEISFKFHIRSMGGSSVLGESDTMITLMSE